jgi:hypothetical protein
VITIIIYQLQDQVIDSSIDQNLKAVSPNGDNFYLLFYDDIHPQCLDIVVRNSISYLQEINTRIPHNTLITLEQDIRKHLRKIFKKAKIEIKFKSKFIIKNICNTD